MCVFSQPVRHVSRTRIFARGLSGGRQLLVYAMTLDAEGDLAMVLPVPVPASSPEDALRFVDLSSCPTFFDQLASLFPAPALMSGEADLSAGVGRPRGMLRVYAVGDFVASFVPTRADFDRLDPRFRLAPSVWDAMPGCADWGFCVFQLRSTSGPTPAAEPAGLVARIGKLLEGAKEHAPAPPSTGPRAYHPMAFELPLRDPSRLFFPTVHVHDGAVHETAEYDHALYCQVPVGTEPSSDEGAWHWSEIPVGTLRSVYEASPASRWLDADAPVHRIELRGERANRDVWVKPAPER